MILLDSVQTFGSRLYGPTGVILYTIAISFSAIGSINSNIFAVGRLVVAASQRGYAPRFFAGSSGAGARVEEGELEITLWELWPRWVVRCFARFAKATRPLRLEQGVPMYDSFSSPNSLSGEYVLTKFFPIQVMLCSLQQPLLQHIY